MANRIFIYGVPGSGKSYYSKKLSKDLKIPVIEADKKIKKKYGTCQAYKIYGGLSEINAVKGLLAVRDETKKAVNSLITDSDFILEGAFLDPESVKKFGRLILLTTLDEKQHRKQFFSHWEKILDFSGNEFKAARIIQKHLIDEARGFGVEIIDSH